MLAALEEGIAERKPVGVSKGLLQILATWRQQSPDEVVLVRLLARQGIKEAHERLLARAVDRARLITLLE